MGRVAPLRTPYQIKAVCKRWIVRSARDVSILPRKHSGPLPSRDGARDPPIRPESTRAEELDAKRSIQRKPPRLDRLLPHDGFALAAAWGSPAPLVELACPLRGQLALLSGPACRGAVRSPSPAQALSPRAGPLP